ncbi:DUF5131 family protein [Mycobacterium avium]|uniref:DUF5131 family protein n=1 Tax=Mycobacterium avium TaxID=1764 RepID=UPI000A023C9B|nr:phage Gp37/Gp68 family protein [Mycobacterium avium]
MSASTKIEWTRGDDGTAGATWSPVTGCSALSPGCDRCYADSIARRFAGTKAWPNGFDVTLWPDRLGIPLRWRRPRRIFVCSTGDLFHDAVPDDFIAQVFAVMAACAEHTFMVLTKRHARLCSLVSRGLLDLVDGWADKYGVRVARWPLPNVWLGVSAENQQWADIRIPALLATPAAVRFVSAEPLLGPIDVGQSLAKWYPDDSQPWLGDRLWARDVLHWVIAGGESGIRARRMDPDWVRALQEQCHRAGIAFFFKQAGSMLAREWGCTGKGAEPGDWPEPFPRQFPQVS